MWNQSKNFKLANDKAHKVIKILEKIPDDLKTNSDFGKILEMLEEKEVEYKIKEEVYEGSLSNFCTKWSPQHHFYGQWKVKPNDDKMEVEEPEKEENEPAGGEGDAEKTADAPKKLPPRKAKKSTEGEKNKEEDEKKEDKEPEEEAQKTAKDEDPAPDAEILKHGFGVFFDTEVSCLRFGLFEEDKLANGFLIQKEGKLLEVVDGVVSLNAMDVVGGWGYQGKIDEETLECSEGTIVFTLTEKLKKRLEEGDKEEEEKKDETNKAGGDKKEKKDGGDDGKMEEEVADAEGKAEGKASETPKKTRRGKKKASAAGVKTRPRTRTRRSAKKAQEEQIEAKEAEKEEEDKAMKIEKDGTKDASKDAKAPEKLKKKKQRSPIAPLTPENHLKFTKETLPVFFKEYTGKLKNGLPDDPSAELSLRIDRDVNPARQTNTKYIKLKIGITSDQDTKITSFHQITVKNSSSYLNLLYSMLPVANNTPENPENTPLKKLTILIKDEVKTRNASQLQLWGFHHFDFNFFGTLEKFDKTVENLISDLRFEFKYQEILKTKSLERIGVALSRNSFTPENEKKGIFEKFFTVQQQGLFSYQRYDDPQQVVPSFTRQVLPSQIGVLEVKKNSQSKKEIEKLKKAREKELNKWRKQQEKLKKSQTEQEEEVHEDEENDEIGDNSGAKTKGRKCKGEKKKASAAKKGSKKASKAGSAKKKTAAKKAKPKPKKPKKKTKKELEAEAFDQELTRRLENKLFPPVEEIQGDWDLSIKFRNGSKLRPKNNSLDYSDKGITPRRDYHDIFISHKEVAYNIQTDTFPVKMYTFGNGEYHETLPAQQGNLHHQGLWKGAGNIVLKNDSKWDKNWEIMLTLENFMASELKFSPFATQFQLFWPRNNTQDGATKQSEGAFRSIRYGILGTLKSDNVKLRSMQNTSGMMQGVELTTSNGVNYEGALHYANWRPHKGFLEYKGYHSKIAGDFYQNGKLYRGSAIIEFSNGFKAYLRREVEIRKLIDDQGKEVENFNQRFRVVMIPFQSQFACHFGLIEFRDQAVAENQTKYWVYLEKAERAWLEVPKKANQSINFVKGKFKISKVLGEGAKLVRGGVPGVDCVSDLVVPSDCYEIRSPYGHLLRFRRGAGGKVDMSFRVDGLVEVGYEGIDVDKGGLESAFKKAKIEILEGGGQKRLKAILKELVGEEAVKDVSAVLNDPKQVQIHPQFGEDIRDPTSIIIKQADQESTQIDQKEPNGAENGAQEPQAKPQTLNKTKICMFYADGSHYIGESVLNTPFGLGTFFYGPQHLLTEAHGHFYGDYLTSKSARLVYSNGGVYEGEVVLGVRQGKGKMTFKNGEVYEGEWLGGLMGGHGLYRWPDGNEYEGAWELGLMWGEGRLKLSNGFVVEGEFAASEAVRASSEVFDGAGKEVGWEKALEVVEGVTGKA